MSTIAIFIKLLATKIVANSFCGFCSRSDTILIALDFSSNSLSISARDKENKATSDPEIRAEQSNKKKNKIIPDTNEASIELIRNTRL